MAPRVEDILVRLKLEGLEGLDRIRSSFRELGKVTQMSEKDILTARTRLLEFANTAGNTEAVISGLIPALKGLRSQVDICGAAYAELSNDIAQVNNVSRGYTDQATAQRNALNAQYGAITNNTEALRRQRAALLDLQQTTRTGSQLYTQLGADIQRTTARLDEMDAVVRRTNAIAERGLPSSAAKIRRDLADVRERIRLERAALDDLNLLTDKQRKNFEQGDLAGESGVRRAIAERQAALNTQLVSAGMLSYSENVRNQREAIRTANAMYSTPKFISGERSPERIGAYLGELPNTVAGLNQQLSELRDRLNNTTLGTRTYVDAALLMAATQRQLREATLGVAAGLVEQLRAGNITPSMANLREVLASVRGEQSLLNTNTAEGARAFQLAEMRARALERQLAALQTTQASLSRTPVSGFGAWSTSVGDRARADRNAFLNLEEQRRASPTGSLTRAQEAQLSSGGFSAADYAAIPEQAARIRRRREKAQRETLQRTGSLTSEQQQLVDAANTANANYATAYRQHQRTLTDAQQQGFNDRLAAQQAAADAELRLQRQVNDAALADFQRRLTQETAVLQQQRAMQRQLGFLGGQNLSSTYQQIVGLSSASAQVSEERMGRNATQVFNDTVASFQAGIAGAAAASVTAPSAVSASRNAGTNLAQSVIQQINRERPDMAAAGASFTDSFVQSVRNKVRAAAQAAQQLAVSTKPKAAATELTSGIVDGIGSATPAVASAAEKFADTFVNTVRRKAGAAADAARQMATSASTAVANTVLGGLPTAAMRVPRLSARTDLLMADPWQGPTGDYSAFISRVIASTERLRSPSLLPTRAESRDLWAGPIGDYNNFISRIISATERVRPQALLTYRAESLDPWSGIIGDYRKFIASIASATTELRSQAILTGTSVRGLLPPRAESRDLWAGPIGDYRNFIAAITTASAELRSQALLTGTSIRGLLTAMAQVRDPWIGAYNDYKNFINSITAASAELRGQALLTGTSIRGLLLPDITTVDPWSLPLSQYKRFIDSIVVATAQLRAQLLLSPAQMPPIRGLLTPTPVRALLPESAASLVPGRIDAQMSRLDQALERSRARSEAVLAEDALAGRMRRLLPMGQETVAAGMGASAGAGAAAANASSAAWQRYTAELGKFGAVSKASIDQLNALKAVLDRQRASLSPLEADYAKVTRAIERQNAVIDRELARRDRSQRPRLSGMQLAQGFGAALTGGIFGGPEGLIGGLAGMGIDGVGGAFAGAAIGAQVGMFRQQLSTITDYSARIDKMQIALRSVVKDQAAYNTVLDAQAAITRDLNIPQENAMRGLTQLSAAVLGAGGTVTDSTFAYRAMTEAIKATGGTAEQVDGALLALTQVFSKGKVSAEELNQIAERMPGTFTLFAKAIGKTGPELSDALKNGEVGLNDLMKFIVLLNKQYGAGALAVSRSSQEAGARLTVTMQAFQRDVGRALQPLGAYFQTAFASFIVDIGPKVVGVVKSIANEILFLAKNGDILLNLAKGFAVLGAAVTAAFVFPALLGGLSTVFTKLVKLGGIVPVITAAFNKLSVSMGIASLMNPFTLAIAGVTALGVALYVFNDDFRTFVNNFITVIGSDFAKAWSDTVVLVQATGWAIDKVFNEIEYAAAQTAKAIDQVFDNAFTRLLTKAWDTYNKLPPFFKTGVINFGLNLAAPGNPTLQYLLGAGMRAAGMGAPAQGQRSTPDPAAALRRRFEAERKRIEEEIARLTQFAGPADTGEGAGGRGRGRANREAERAQREAQQAAEELAKQRIRLADLVHQHELDLINKRYELERDLINKQRDIWAQSQTGAARSTATTVNQFLREIEDLQARIRDAETAVTRASQGLRSAQAMSQYQSAAYAAATGPSAAGVMGTYLQGGIGPSGPNTYGPHFDIKRTDLSYFERAALDAYVRVNGRPLSTGTTVPGGEFYARRQGRPHHGGWDYAFGAGAQLSLTGGARWLGSSPSDYGDAAAFMTPDGKVYKVIHGRFQPAAGTTAATTVQTTTGAEVNRGQGDVAAAQQELAQAKALRDQLTQQFAPQVRLAVQSATLQLTDELRSQNATLEDNVRLNELRNALQYAGVDQVIIDAELRKAEAAQKTSQQIELLNKLYDDAKGRLDALSKTLKAGDPALVAAQEVTNAYATQIADLNTELQRFVWLTDDATAAQLAFAQALSGRDRKGDQDVGAGIRDGVDASLKSIGTLRSAVADFTSTSLNGLGDALINLSTKGAADFRAFAVSMLNDLSQLIIKQFVFNTLLNWIRNLGGGGGFGVPSLGGIPGFSSGFTGPAIPFTLNAMGNAYAANGIVPFAYGGVVDQPMLFPFAKGGAMQTGVMGEADPEAIIPLKRGRDGRLGVSGGGNVTNVNVTVDASNTSAAGNNAQGQALGRAISRAVQSELVTQQRPGGLLDPNRSR